MTQMLKIKVQNSSTLKSGTILEITPQGLQDSKRLANDGITYFGYKRKSIPNGPITSDFVIPSVANQQDRETQFLIYFNPDFKAYFLRDLGKGGGTYIKVADTLTLAENQLLNMGDSYLVINILKKSINDPYPTLATKLYSGTRIGEVRYFYAQECYVKEIYIGRAGNCQIYIEDNLISTHQATIFYSSSKGWMLVDGDLTTQRPSTNGTWYSLYRICATQDYEFTTSTSFKVCQSLFKANLV